MVVTRLKWLEVVSANAWSWRRWVGEKMSADDRIVDTERGFESQSVVQSIDSPTTSSYLTTGNAGPIMGVCT